MKVIAIFDINEEELNATPTQSVDDELGWVEESGIYLIDSIEVPDDTNLQECIKL